MSARARARKDFRCASLARSGEIAGRVTRVGFEPAAHRGHMPR
jgi:hypothetical protein